MLHLTFHSDNSESNYQLKQTTKDWMSQNCISLNY